MSPRLSSMEKSRMLVESSVKPALHMGFLVAKRAASSSLEVRPRLSKRPRMETSAWWWLNEFQIPRTIHWHTSALCILNKLSMCEQYSATVQPTHVNCTTVQPTHVNLFINLANVYNLPMSTTLHLPVVSRKAAQRMRSFILC